MTVFCSSGLTVKDCISPNLIIHSPNGVLKQRHLILVSLMLPFIHGRNINAFNSMVVGVYTAVFLVGVCVSLCVCAPCLPMEA